jgi:ADP-ribosylglycohydrolase
VNAGWDTDTMAAICGNFSGAFNGFSGIPEHWLKYLENDYKGRDYLLRLADCLHHHTQMEGEPNQVLDYICDFAHNTLFLTQMLFLKPMY